MKTFSVLSIKGGAGKTVATGSLAQAAALEGKRVLCVDLDPQASLSFWLGSDPDAGSAFDVFAEGLLPIQSTASGVDLIAGSGDLIATKTFPESARRLEKALQEVRRNYDLVFVDTAPGLGELMNNAIFAADKIIIPLRADILSLHGLFALLGIVQQAKESKRSISYAGALLTQYDGRATASRQLKELIEEEAEENKIPYLGEVRSCIKITEAVTMSEPLYTYAPKCTAALDYLRIYHTITEGEK